MNKGFMHKRGFYLKKPDFRPCRGEKICALTGVKVRLLAW